MKKLLFLLLTILFFSACEKQIPKDKTQEEIADISISKKSKIIVCHYDALTGTSKTIEVTENALAAHLAQGDLVGDCSQVLTTICDQDWMIKNLDVDHYRNGDPIPQVTDPAIWATLTTGAWCWYANNSANGPVYGKLYNWFAVNDPRGLAPVGWHVPSDAEWTTLTDCLGGESVAGGKMKEAGTTHWQSPNTGADNSSGFTGLPGGARDPNGTFTVDFGYVGFWWSSTEYNTANAWDRDLYYGNAIAYRYYNGKAIGFSVRCVRDYN
jgi:uncharacterized protein (TIGR02145 family)